MQAWSGTLKKAKVAVGMDANEEFTDADDTGLRAHTERGEAVLAAALPSGVAAPLQELATASYHPYNTQHRSRRLDYILARGVQASQLRGGHRRQPPHGPFGWMEMCTEPIPKQSRPTWGERRFRNNADITAIAGAPLQQEDTHAAVSRIALNTTVQGK